QVQEAQELQVQQAASGANDIAVAKRVLVAATKDRNVQDPSDVRKRVSQKLGVRGRRDHVAVRRTINALSDLAAAKQADQVHRGCTEIGLNQELRSCG